MKYRAGLVGAGYVSEFHVAALRRAHVEIVGICDIDPARAREAAERFGIGAMDSPADLASAGANVLHILTPPHTHTQLVLEALELGCHVLVEKPLATDVEDCLRIQRAAAQKDLRVCVNHSLLYDPQVRRAIQIVRSGKIGKVVAVDILRSSTYPPFVGGPLPPQYRTGGYAFRDLGVHCLYLLEAILGPIQDVHADWKSLGGDPNLAFDEWRAQVRCRDGLGQFQLSWNVRPLQHQIIIQGTRGVLRVDLFLMFKALRKTTPLPKAAERIVNALTDSLRPLIEVPRNVLRFAFGRVVPFHGLQDLVRSFYQSLEQGAEVPVSVAQATEAIRWTEQIAREADAQYAATRQSLRLSDAVPFLVTGASGGLGSQVVKRLIEAGKRVRILVRRIPDDLPENVEVAIGDLGDPEAVERAVLGAQTVIHVGAAMKGGWIEHQCATIRGTQNVIDASIRHGIKKLVHVSSLSVIQWAGAAVDTPVDEDSPLESRAEERGSYTRAKLEAERLVSAAAREHGLKAVILRPGQIFGGRIPVLTGAVARRLGRRWLVLGNGKVRLPLVYIDDVVDAILRAVQTDLQGTPVIQLVDDFTPTQNELIRIVCGKGVRIVRLPRWIVSMLGKLSEPVFRLLRRQSPVALYRLRSALARRTFRSIHAQSLLNWCPRVGVREGLGGISSGSSPAQPPQREPSPPAPAQAAVELDAAFK